MKSVLISIKPKYCGLIANGKKTIELRKTRPKLETPFKCYIYETKAKCDVPQFVDEDGHVDYRGRGQVIGEFMCDEVFEWHCGYDGRYDAKCRAPMTCLNYREMYAYGQGRTLYGWHISDMKIYDKPKELSEFKGMCKYMDRDCFACPYYDYGIMDCKARTIKRPPQSWCYVEEVE